MSSSLSGSFRQSPHSYSNEVEWSDFQDVIDNLNTGISSFTVAYLNILSQFYGNTFYFLKIYCTSHFV